jgi:hypothetical protein
VEKLFSFVLALAVVLPPAPAHALLSGRIYNASVNGAAEGIMRFELDSKVPGGACRYAAEWGPVGVPTELCYVDEATWFGHQSCVENALGPFNSVIVNAPGLPCWGYDSWGQDTVLFKFLVVEEGWTGLLQGLIQFSAAAPRIYGFAADPDKYDGSGDDD